MADEEAAWHRHVAIEQDRVSAGGEGRLSSPGWAQGPSATVSRSVAGKSSPTHSTGWPVVDASA